MSGRTRSGAFLDALRAEGIAQRELERAARRLETGTPEGDSVNELRDRLHSAARAWIAAGRVRAKCDARMMDAAEAAQGRIQHVEPHVIACGEMFGGMRLIGPFEGAEEAGQYADRLKGFCWILALDLPAKEDDTEEAPSEVIQLTPAEVQSGTSRVRWAEGLILQLPSGHEGRDSWLLNYGEGEESDSIRAAEAEKRRE